MVKKVASSITKKKASTTLPKDGMGKQWGQNPVNKPIANTSNIDKIAEKEKQEIDTSIHIGNADAGINPVPTPTDPTRKDI